MIAPIQVTVDNKKVARFVESCLSNQSNDHKTESSLFETAGQLMGDTFQFDQPVIHVLTSRNNVPVEAHITPRQLLAARFPQFLGVTDQDKRFRLKETSPNRSTSSVETSLTAHPSEVLPVNSSTHLKILPSDKRPLHIKPSHHRIKPCIQAIISKKFSSAEIEQAYGSYLSDPRFKVKLRKDDIGTDPEDRTRFHCELTVAQFLKVIHPESTIKCKDATILRVDEYEKKDQQAENSLSTIREIFFSTPKAKLIVAKRRLGYYLKQTGGNTQIQNAPYYYRA